MSNDEKNKPQVIPDSGFHQAFIIRTPLPHMQYWPSFIDTIAFFVVWSVWGHRTGDLDTDCDTFLVGAIST